MQDCYIYAEKRSDKETTALSLACCVKLSLSEHEQTAPKLSLLIHGKMVQQLIQPELVIVLRDVSSQQILSLPLSRETGLHWNTLSTTPAGGGCELTRSTLVSDSIPGPHSQSG